MASRSTARIGSGARGRCIVAAALASVLAAPVAVQAGEGGTTHVIPGSLATLVDIAPAAGPLTFVKPMYMHYSGSASARIPTAAGLAADLDASSNTFALAAGHAFETQFLGATYSVVAALPYTWLTVTGNVQTPGGATRRIRNSVDGFGDLTVIPTMMAWKSGNMQYNFILPIYAPTGSYEKGRLGNTGLNYWTFDPTVGAVYASDKGLNALLHAGFAMNTENNATSYRSGNLMHFDGAVQQVLPAGKGFVTLGAEGFYYQQVSCDSGAGATLGCFKGRTAGIGPVLGYVQQLGKTEQFLVELKWLPEIETRNRLNGDYIWLKAVYKF